MSGNGVQVGVEFSDVAARLKPEIDGLLARYPEPRSALLPIMHRVQQEMGFVSPEAIAHVAALLGLTPAVVESTISFYTLLFRRPVGRYMLQPCRGLACVINGAYDVMTHFRERLGLEHLETSEDGLFSYEEVECLAACDRAPCMQVNLEFVHDLTKENVDEMLAAIRGGNFAIAPLTQSEKPGKTWIVEPEMPLRSKGAMAVPAPDAPGGVGDATGERMLRRLAEDPHPIEVRPTSERAVREVKRA